MNLATLPLIYVLNVWVIVLPAIVIICVGIMIYKFLQKNRKEEGWAARSSDSKDALILK